MSKFGWLINKDYDYGDNLDGSKTKIMGPRNMTATKEEIETNGIQFKLYDADDNLYYSGYVLEDTDYNGMEDRGLFMPLDHYGMPNAGAVTMKILDKTTNTWKVL